MTTEQDSKRAYAQAGYMRVADYVRCREVNRSIHTELAELALTLHRACDVATRAGFRVSALDETEDVLDSLRAMNAIAKGLLVLADIHLLEIANREREDI